MKNYLFKLNSSIGSYYAEESEEISSFGYAAKFRSIGTCDFKWNKLEADFYTDGKLEDIQLNGWTFSHHIEGRHRIYKQMGPDSPEFTIKGLDPEQHLLEVKIYSFCFFKEAAADFMNNITLISKFSDRDIAAAYYDIKNWKRGEKSVDILPLLEEIKTFHTWKCNEIPDELFWEKIRKSVDKTIVDYKETIDSLRI